MVVLGPEATPANLGLLLDVSIDQIRAASRALAQSNRVAGRGTLRLALASDTDAVLALSDPVVLSRLHATAALILHDQGAPAVDVASHLIKTEPVREGWVLEVLERAARQHEELGNHPARLAVLRHLLTERPPAALQRRVLYEVAQAEAAVDPGAAQQHFRQAIAMTDAPADRFAIRLSLARCLTNVDALEEALEQLSLASQEAGTVDEHLKAGVLYVSTARTSLDTRPFGIERLRRLQHELRDVGEAKIGADVYAELAYEACLTGEPKDEILALVSRALGGPALLGAHDMESATLHVAALTLIWCGELRDVERLSRMVLARSTRRGAAVVSALANHWLVQVAWRRSRLDEAIEYCDAVLEVAERAALPLLPATLGFKGLLLAMKGEIDLALETLALPGGEDRWSGYAHFHGYLHASARLHLLIGDPASAYRLATRLGTLANSMGTMNPGVLPWRSIAAMALAELGDRVSGRVLADEGIAMARRFGAPGPLQLALRAGAANRELPEEQAGLLEEAVKLSQQTPDRFEQAQCIRQLARVRHALGQQAAAATLLRSAADLAEQIGAVPLASAVAADLADLDRRRAVTPAPAPAISERDAGDFIRVLGQFAVIDRCGRNITPGGVPGRALRILVAAGGALHLEELGDRLWDEPIDAGQTKQRLRNVISRARGSAGPLIVRRGELVELREGVKVDAVRFEEAAGRALEWQGDGALEAGLIAVSLYAGDLLPSDPFADWAALPRERLRRRFLTVLDLSARRAMEAGTLDLAIDLLETGIHHDLYDDERYARTAELYEQTGRFPEGESLRRRAAEVRASLGLA